MADTIPDDSQVKTCIDCALTQPVTAFRYRRKGQPQRQGFCRPCYNARMREYRRRQRDKRFNQFAGELARARSTSAVNVMASAMLRRFGSPDRLGEALFGAITTAARNKRTVGRALLSMFAVMRVLEVRDAAKPPEPDFSTVPTADLERAIAEYVLAHPRD